MAAPILIDFAWALLGGVGAVIWESAARHPHWSWTKLILVCIPAQIAIAAGVYKVASGAPRFMGGILIFSAAVWIMRGLVSQLYFHEVVPLRTWVACALVLVVAVLDRVN